MPPLSKVGPVLLIISPVSSLLYQKIGDLITIADYGKSNTGHGIAGASIILDLAICIGALKNQIAASLKVVLLYCPYQSLVQIFPIIYNRACRLEIPRNTKRVDCPLLGVSLSICLQVVISFPSLLVLLGTLRVALLEALVLYLTLVYTQHY